MSETPNEPPGDDQPEAQSPEPPEPVQGMTEQQIRAAGYAIDVPFETGPGRTGPIRYAEGAGEKWEPEPGWEERMFGNVPPTPEEPEPEAGAEPEPE